MNTKRIFSLLIVCVMLISTLTCGFTVAADELLTTDADEYAVGSPILVSATGSGKDWVGIYCKDETPKSVNSIYWYYVDGNASNINIAQQTHNSDRSALKNLPAGDYTIYLFENDGYNVLASKDIKIVNGELPSAPLSVTYERTSDKTGYADGNIVVTLEEGNKATDLILYFADENGEALEGYSHLQMQHFSAGTTEVSFSLVSNTLVPGGAKKLIVYASNDSGVSAEFAAVDLPDGISDYDFGEPLYEFQVVTDTHVTDKSAHLHSKHFDGMLRDVADISPDSKALVIIGDITDNGFEDEYKNVLSIYNSISGVPTMLWAIGNHDLGLASGDYERQKDLFLKYSEAENVYYDKWIGGAHFIFLGDEEIDTVRGTDAYISNTQFSWLEEKLAEDYVPGRPIFVFMHQSIYNTVAGSLKGQDWDGIGNYGRRDNADVRLMEILAEYPEAIYFTGHSHWELNSEQNMYAATDEMCTAFNAASVGYLWTSYGDAPITGEYYNDSKGGSQGFYIEVYEDKVLVLGRDFEEKEWMPSAMYCVDLSGLSGDTASDATARPDDTGIVQGNTAIDKATEEPSDEGNKGCGSVLGTSSFALITLCGATLLARPRKKR